MDVFLTEEETKELIDLDLDSLADDMDRVHRSLNSLRVADDIEIYFE